MPVTTQRIQVLLGQLFDLLVVDIDLLLELLQHSKDRIERGFECRFMQKRGSLPRVSVNEVRVQWRRVYTAREAHRRLAHDQDRALQEVCAGLQTGVSTFQNCVPVHRKAFYTGRS